MLLVYWLHFHEAIFPGDNESPTGVCDSMIVDSNTGEAENDGASC